MKLERKRPYIMAGFVCVCDFVLCVCVCVCAETDVGGWGGRFLNCASYNFIIY